MGRAIKSFNRVDLAYGETKGWGDERSVRATTGLRLERVTLKRVIQCGLAAGKAFQSVLDGRRLRGPQGHWMSQVAYRKSSR